MKRYLVWLAGLWLSVGAAAAADVCKETRADLRGPGGQARFSVEVVDTVETRALGLMHRETMATSHGMLFIYPSEEPVSFWMENTLIPLDMLFIDGRGVVQHVHRNAKPLDRRSIRSNGPVRMVLEINGGMAARLGIAPGAELRHPRLDQSTAAWPCDDAGPAG